MLRRIGLWISLFVFALLGYATTASAHPLSASFTKVAIADDHVEMIFALDETSVMEQLAIDTNQDGALDQQEIDAFQSDIYGLIDRNLVFEAGGIAQRGEAVRPLYKQRNDTWVVEMQINYPLSENARDIGIRDGFYADAQGKIGYSNFVTVERDGEVTETILSGDHREWTMTLGEKGVKGKSSWTEFFVLGMEHILTGYDHLLFLLALLLAKQTLKEYVQVVTAFTIAHSLTITLSVLGWVHLPSRFVESFIAFSICYVAAENMIRKKVQLRWTVTFLFGLVHGLGFAGILTEMDIPKSHLAISMVSFNVGIEAIQLALILAVVPLLRYVQKQQSYAFGARFVSSIIIAVGAFWLVERLIG